MKVTISHLLYAFILSVSSFSVAASTQPPEGLNASEWSGIQSAIEADRYRAQLLERESGEASRIELNNPEHGLKAVFDRSGLSLTPSSVSSTQWTLDMRLVAWGRKGQASTFEMLESVMPVIANDRIEYRHTSLTEWFVNDSRGLEQGFTIAQRPAGDGSQPIRIELALGGALGAELLENGEGLILRDSEGVEKIRYAGLLAWDVDGRDLPVTLVRTTRGLALEVPDTQARYPLTIDPFFTEIVKLEGDGLGEECLTCDFGYAVSVSGDTALIGASRDGNEGLNSGAAYVFIHNGGAWTLQQKLTASDAADERQFGSSVSISNDTALIGAWRDNDHGNDSGAAYVFVRSGSTWTQKQKLVAIDAAGGSDFGRSVAIHGNTALIGAWRDSNEGSYTGAAYVFINNGLIWLQQQKLTASDGSGVRSFGASVSIFDDTAVVSAYWEDHERLRFGSVYVFTRSGSSWSEQQKLNASDGIASDGFGSSVSISGNTVLVGAPLGGGSTGSAYVFVRSGSSWTEQQKLIASDGIASDSFGYSVSISGNTVLVGAPFRGGYGGTGAAYGFTRSGSTWTEQQKLTGTGYLIDNRFGYSVSVSGDTSLIGAYFDSEMDNRAGSAYVFTRIASNWYLESKLFPVGSAQYDEFGWSVSISGDTALIGARYDNDNGFRSGSAYVFFRSSSGWILQQKITATDGELGDQFGHSVSIFGDTALIGAHKRNVNGVVYVYTHSGGIWTEQQQLSAIDGEPTHSDEFGAAVSVYKDTALIGSPGADGISARRGSAYVFIRNGNSWTLQAKFTTRDGSRTRAFGRAVSLSGDTALVGAFEAELDSLGRGSVYVYVISGGSWTEQQMLMASDGEYGSNFGRAVSLSGDIALIGEPHDGHAGRHSGSAYVFFFNGSSWIQQQKLTANDAAISDQFGGSVSVSGDIALVGAFHDDNRGSAYFFIFNGSSWIQQQKLNANDSVDGDQFGWSVSVSGDTALIGANLVDDHEVDVGAAYIFDLTDCTDGTGSVCDNTAPVAVDNNYTVLEDNQLAGNVITNDTSEGVDSDVNGDGLSMSSNLGTSHGTLVFNPDNSGSFTYDPVEDYCGPDSFDYVITDNSTNFPGPLTSNTATVSITVTCVNDVPSFTKGGDETVLEDAGAQAVPAWATTLSAGPPNESGQTLSFNVANDNNGLFSSQPAIDASGQLTYTPAADANGVAVVTVSIMDDGGTANGGVDTSAVQAFNITVTPVNDEPSFTHGGNQSVPEDSGLQTVTGFATASPGGGPDEVGQTFIYSVSNNNNALFSAQPAIDASGQLTYTSVANGNGLATVTVSVMDSGGTANGGDDTSPDQMFDIEITPVNDPPTVTSVDPSAQTSDYSDDIGTVTIQVTDIDDNSTGLAESNEPTLSAAGLSLASTGCSVDNTLSPNPAENGSVCSWTYDGQILDPGDNVHSILFTPSDGDGPDTGGADSHSLTIHAEDATVMLDSGNDVAVEVVEDGGASGLITLMFTAYETDSPDTAHDGSPEFGDLNKAEAFISLVPVGPGGTITVNCDIDGTVGVAPVAAGYDQILTASCDFMDVPVNTYEVVAEVDGLSGTSRYYYGLDEAVLVVYDPSLGFTTGGGWFYWPGTADPALLDCGSEGYLGDKTNIGFNAKFNKKGTNVQGSLLLIRHTVDEDCLNAGNYRVKSNALYGLAIGSGTDDGTGITYGWAVFSGKSTYREPGLDNEGNHPFLVYVEDRDEQGCNQDPADEFWIEVKDRDGVVSLQLNGPEPTDEDPAFDGDDEPIKCGNIIVPHKTGGKDGGGGKKP